MDLNKWVEVCAYQQDLEPLTPLSRLTQNAGRD